MEKIVNITAQGSPVYAVATRKIPGMMVAVRISSVLINYAVS